MIHLHCSANRNEQIQLTTNSHNISLPPSDVKILKMPVILRLFSTFMPDIFIYPNVILASKVNEDAAKSKGSGGRGVGMLTVTKKY